MAIGAGPTSVDAPQMSVGCCVGLVAVRSGGACGGSRSTATTLVGDAGLSLPTASIAVTQYACEPEHR